ncbi:MAG: hypothetical protein B6D59_05075 [Campylobacteraceae bacterium 4484_4]|nr:MAG: hypothetical protein B6D59_05075 [Campylobacteraceae bacterium 4484_4]
MRRFTLGLTLLAAMGTVSFADIKVDKVSGNARLFYSTDDSEDFFDKESSLGDVSLSLDIAAQINCCILANFGITGVSTLGLENTLVSGTWINHGLDDAIWIDTANIVFKPLADTTMILGRQELDTPMVFTERWNIAQNTYDAAVIANGSLPDTTLIAAWVGRSNIDGGNTVKADGISNNGFDTFVTDEGAYAFGAVTKAIPGVTAQAWYYIAPSTANIAWLQADGSVAGFDLGGQYLYTDPDSGDTGSGFALKVGYNFADLGLGLSAAYSSTDEDLFTANNLSGAQSKLYTESWWTPGEVGQADTDAFNITATYDMANIANFGLYYTNADHSTAADMSEITLTAAKSIGNLDVTLAYINTDIDDGSDAVNTLQANFTYNF